MRSNKLEIILVLVAALFISEFIVVFTCAGFEGKTEVEHATVIEVKEKSLKVEIGSIEGDPQTYEIDKPFFLNPKVNDTISIKYNEKDNSNIHYVPDVDIVASIPVIIIMSIIFIIITVNVVEAIIETKKKKVIKNNEV